MQRESSRHDFGDLARGPATGPASSEALVDALGMAFSTFTLYEDPRGVEAYGRAIETLGRAPHYPWRAGVGVDGFSLDGEPVAVRRDGSLRFSRALFALGIAAMDLQSAPHGDDLYQLLRLLNAPEATTHAGDALASAGVRSIRLLDRAMLHAAGDDDNEDESRPAVAVEDDGPAGFVLRMLEGGDSGPRAVSRRFVEEYERAHLLIGLDDTWGTEELVHAFVDGFWYLPEAHRAQIFSLMLERGHRPENTAFLDQFGGIELAQLNRMFGTDGHPLLSEYLRVAADEGSRYNDDLGSLLAGDHLQSLTTRIVGQVASVLRARSSEGITRPETAVDRLSTAHPNDIDDRRSISNVLRGLFALAVDAESFERTARVWAGRVCAALANGDLPAADEWVAAVGSVGIDDDSRLLLIDALAAAATGAAVDTLARLISAPDQKGPGARVRKAAPHFAADGLIKELSLEGKSGRRKSLLTALQIVARLKPDRLLPHLSDPRWFVIRNLAVAMGTSQHPEMAAHLQPLTSHIDHRVRLEALRALYRLTGDSCSETLLSATTDEHAAVAAEAGRLLGGIAAPGIDRRLIGMIESGDVAAATAAVAALGWRKTDAARGMLHRLAHRKFVWGRARHLKSAARKAQGSQR